MYLTKEEEAILNGEEGETLRKSIEILVALGDIYGADKLIPIKSAQIAGVSYKTIGDAGLEWISNLDGKVKVPSVLNPAGMDITQWKGIGITEEFAKKQNEIIQVYQNLGINIQCTCTPYYLKGFNTEFGDHISWSESSAVSYANSVLGARTNREGGPSALSAALIGKTANYGLHLNELRVPRISIIVESNLSESDYGALGVIAGKMCGNKVPIFYLNHLKNRPSNDELKALGAAMAATGSVALYHVNGVTPEAIKLKFDKPHEVIIIEEKEIQEIYKIKKDTEECDIITVGCPHCSYDELKTIAKLLDGKIVNKTVWIYTSREIAEKYSNLVNIIEKSGAVVICDTCMVVSPATENYNSMMVNSGKALVYVPSLCKVNTQFSSLEDCILSAID